MQRAAVAVDGLTKWWVSFCVFGVGVYHTTPTNALPAYYLTCAVGCAMLCKYLKRVLRHRRPADSPLSTRDEQGAETHGMPSTHAGALAFLSSLPVVAFAGYDYLGVGSAALLGSPGAAVLCAAGPCLGLALAALRVVVGHHTAAQVVVGCLVGWACACVSFALDVELLRVQQWSPAVCGAVIAGGTAVFVAMLAFFVRRKVMRDSALRRRAL